MVSKYPDGTTRDCAVVLPPREHEDPTKRYRVVQSRVHNIICHRNHKDLGIQYLVQWRHASKLFYSWHTLDELSDCLLSLQNYIHEFRSTRTKYQLDIPIRPGGTLKRKSPGATPSSENSRCSTPASSSSFLSGGSDEDTYGCLLIRQDGKIYAKPLGNGYDSADEVLPTYAMRQRAAGVSNGQALYRIRMAFNEGLLKLISSEHGVPITVVDEDGTSPSLEIEFITRSRHGEGVHSQPLDTVVGCGSRHVGSNQRCRPAMGQTTEDGQGIGCEYGRVCDCLEFAAVDESRLNEQDKQRMRDDPHDLMGLPKRFPYTAPTAQNKKGCLVNFYLDSRHPIYECNLRCDCGPSCRTRVVQKGRKVPLEIFKTKNKGWGLRCSVDLEAGQFIDTYRGEIITNEEADRREQTASADRAIYLYTLDKHVDDENELEIDDCYVVDGEKMSGPSRFINHSCDPNCQQHTVHFNKYDLKIYELAFFANRNIPAYTELTFDYLDKDTVEDDASINEQVQEGDEGMICRCGSTNPQRPCRGKLFM